MRDDVVREDRRLEAATDLAGEALARHRWHWTLDESNSERVSIREYARSVGRGFGRIQAMVNGFARWQAQGDLDVEVTALSLIDCIELAKGGAEKEAATLAIAGVTGKTPSNVSAHMRQEVQAVRALATERAERLGTSVNEQLEPIAKRRADARVSKAMQRAQRREKHDLRYMEIEGELGRAARAIRSAITVARGVELEDEELELLQITLNNVRALLGMLEARLTGDSGTDWDRAAEELLR